MDMQKIDLKIEPSQQFVYTRTYSRWMEEKQRRELNWNETMDRYFGFMQPIYGEKVPKAVWARVEAQARSMGSMPSMRAAWAAGAALGRNNVTGYNCAYLPFIDLRCPAELLFILMCGAGAGFSVEAEFISQMPDVQKSTGNGRGVFVVDDSKEGWALSLLAGLEAWFAGDDIEFDYTKIRPRGARLLTMGGRASGPGPLKKLHEFARKMIRDAQGRKLTSVEWLDIGNVIGDVVVVGGVRRSSEITFSDIDDEPMSKAKSGNYPDHRGMSNNSAVYFSKPSIDTFLREWTNLVGSKRGERGIFNVGGIEKHIPKRRKFVRWFRCNPCGEIILRPFQFCNLTEVVVRATDTFDDLLQKIEAAVWMGVMQAGLTNFPFLRPEWKKNCDEEALLGVSLTGQMDNPDLLSADRLQVLKEYAFKVAKKASKAVGVNLATAITTGKPSGTVSQLVNAASGAHARHAKHYIRRYRINGTDPLYRMMKAQGVKFTPENGQGPEDVAKKRAAMLAEGYDQNSIDILQPEWSEDGVQTWVCSFPIKAPEKCITRHEIGAIQHLEWYLKLKENFCEHNQSITVYVRDDEWMKVGAWVYDHFDDIIGITFLPSEDPDYKQLPYEDIDAETYEKLAAEFPEIDYSKLSQFELDDNTTGAQQLACSGSSCEIN
jgi:ribonucleoside-triphosphate reductase